MVLETLRNQKVVIAGVLATAIILYRRSDTVADAVSQAETPDVAMPETPSFDRIDQRFLTRDPESDVEVEQFEDTPDTVTLPDSSAETDELQDVEVEKPPEFGSIADGLTPSQVVDSFSDRLPSDKVWPQSVKTDPKTGDTYNPAKFEWLKNNVVPDAWVADVEGESAVAPASEINIAPNGSLPEIDL